ncbi:MAG: hypothetical protein IPG91_03730 [Ideonella sp.]|nr:hypothetical protein [Ideonella sp.]
MSLPTCCEGMEFAQRTPAGDETAKSTPITTMFGASQAFASSGAAATCPRSLCVGTAKVRIETGRSIDDGFEPQYFTRAK